MINLAKFVKIANKPRFVPLQTIYLSLIKNAYNFDIKQTYFDQWFDDEHIIGLNIPTRCRFEKEGHIFNLFIT